MKKISQKQFPPCAHPLPPPQSSRSLIFEYLHWLVAFWDALHGTALGLRMFRFQTSLWKAIQNGGFTGHRSSVRQFVFACCVPKSPPLSFKDLIHRNYFSLRNTLFCSWCSTGVRKHNVEGGQSNSVRRRLLKTLKLLCSCVVAGQVRLWLKPWKIWWVSGSMVSEWSDESVN